MSKKYTRKELILKLKKLAAHLGRTPRVDHLTEYNITPSAATYYNYFESYPHACRLAGLRPNKRGYTDAVDFEYLLDETESLEEAEKYFDEEVQDVIRSYLNHNDSIRITAELMAVGTKRLRKWMEKLEIFKDEDGIWRCGYEDSCVRRATGVE